MNTRSRMHAALYSGMIGDALGVPVQQRSRDDLTLCAVKNLLGYGRYDQPEGTWSDDTSMTLCTMESLIRGYDPADLATTFSQWLFESKWTPTGFVFDSGVTTFTALERFRSGECQALCCGGPNEEDNGNGSLMRMLPTVLYFLDESRETLLDRVHEVSSITHRHPRALLACGIYALFVRELFRHTSKSEAYAHAMAAASEHYNDLETFEPQLHHFDRLLSGKVPTLGINEIASSGYVVDTLEASIWCFMNGESTKEILLSAVNLGLDTDTTGMVAGGMAGLWHGLESVPNDWIQSLARRNEIEQLLQSFLDTVLSRRTTSDRGN